MKHLKNSTLHFIRPRLEERGASPCTPPIYLIINWLQITCNTLAFGLRWRPAAALCVRQAQPRRGVTLLTRCKRSAASGSTPAGTTPAGTTPVGRTPVGRPPFKGGRGDSTNPSRQTQVLRNAGLLNPPPCGHPLKRGTSKALWGQSPEVKPKQHKQQTIKQTNQ